MNACLITGAILAVMISFVHSYLGERYILTRLFRRVELPHLFGSDRFTRQTLRFVWHLASIAWLGFAGIMLSFTITDPIVSRRVALQVISLTFTIHTFAALLSTRGRHLAWIVFLAISIATWLGIG